MQKPDKSLITVETTVIDTSHGKGRKTASNTKRIAAAGVLLALALILSLIESYIPPLIPAAPYAKIGFANVVLISVLLLLGYKYCFVILIIKCVFTGIFSGNMFSVVYSLPAGIIAYTISAVLFYIPRLSVVAVSTISSIIHNLVQVLIASVIISCAVWLTAPYLLLIGAIAGVGVGLISFLLIKSLPSKFIGQLEN